MKLKPIFRKCLIFIGLKIVEISVIVLLLGGLGLLIAKYETIALIFLIIFIAFVAVMFCIANWFWAEDIYNKYWTPKTGRKKRKITKNGE